MQKILLLNPPVFKKKRFIRSGYCNSVSKGGYYWAPIDLLVQSGILKNDFDVIVLDAAALNWSSAKTLNYLEEKFPQGLHSLLFITSLASFQFDYEFIYKLKIILHLKKILVSAGFLLFNNNIILSEKLIDGVLIDYTSKETIDFFNNIDKNYNTISTINFNKTVDELNSTLSNEFDYPIPLHKKFALNKYYMPNCKKLPMTNVITNLGCPYKCDFCTWSNLKYRQRNIDNTIEELKYLQKINIKEIMFIDPTFGANKKHSKELLKRIIDENLKFNFSIECRIDLIEEEFILLLKKAGCHSITFGLESGNDYILKNIQKNFTVNDIKSAFSLCHKLGIAPTGHFIIGLPGETKRSILNTLNLAIDIKCDFASFNIVMPLPGTELFKKSGYNSDEIKICSDTEKPVFLQDTDLNPNEILKYSKLSFKKFYFRYEYIFYKLKKTLNYISIIIIFKELYHTIKKYAMKS